MKQIKLLKQAILLADNADLKNMLLQVLQANTPEISTKFIQRRTGRFAYTRAQGFSCAL